MLLRADFAAHINKEHHDTLLTARHTTLTAPITQQQPQQQQQQQQTATNNDDASAGDDEFTSIGPSRRAADWTRDAPITNDTDDDSNNKQQSTTTNDNNNNTNSPPLRTALFDHGVYIPRAIAGGAVASGHIRRCMTPQRPSLDARPTTLGSTGSAFRRVRIELAR
jgi:hypothetical protein